MANRLIETSSIEKCEGGYFVEVKAEVTGEYVINQIVRETKNELQEEIKTLESAIQNWVYDRKERRIFYRLGNVTKVTDEPKATEKPVKNTKIKAEEVEEE